MENEPNKKSFEAEFYASEIENANKQLETKKKEALRVEATINWLGKVMTNTGLDDEMSVHEALSKIAIYSERGAEKTYETDAVVKALDEYHEKQRFMKLGEIKEDLAERYKVLEEEIEKIVDDAELMEGRNYEDDEKPRAENE